MKLKLLKIINIFMIFFYLFTALSILFYKFIPGPWQWSETLYNVHIYIGGIFIIVAILHFILNWKWIRSTYLKKK